MTRAVLARWAVLGFAMCLTACVTEHPIDFDRAQLMPEPAAKQIVASMLPQYDGGTMLLQGRDPPVSIKSVTEVMFVEQRSAISLWKGTKLYATRIGLVCGATMEKARQLAAALTALGAQLILEDSTNGALAPC